LIVNLIVHPLSSISGLSTVASERNAFHCYSDLELIEF
jgi:hypothetical protein